ncbi:MAG: hypothetical protein R6U41_03545 [Desulfosalsimonas sp.]|uniref:hypothetical protein n=1 Tax=Desulfosalsimonas sp. TaxID=3073848 RepID=UPI0039705E95
MMLAFDHQMRRLGFAGNQAQIVLGLSGRLSGSELEARLHIIRGRFPILAARVKRGLCPWNPCWHLPSADKQAYPRVFCHEPGEEDDLHRTKADILNHRLDTRGGELVRFDLVHTKAGDTDLVMTWSHMLMDVNGAQYLLGIIGKSVQCGDKYTQADLLSGSYTERLPAGAKLPQAGKSFARVDELAACPPVSLYTAARRSLAPRFDYRVVSFSPGQTETILEMAEKRGGFLNASAFYISASMAKFHQFLQARQVCCPGYVVPMSVDLRKKGTHLPVFTNQAATLLCGFSPGQIREFDAVLESFKQQTQAAVRQELIESNTCAMELARFIPARLYSAKIRKAFAGEIASLVFANPGAVPAFLYEFMGHGVTSLHHVPTVVVPPGMGIVFYTFSDCLHITLVYVESLISADEAEAFLSAVGKQLLSGRDT